MALLNKADILKHTGSCGTRTVPVPEWGGEVLVRGMTIKEFELNQARADDGKATAAVLARCVLADDSGRPMFSKDDTDQLAELPLSGVSIVSKAIMELSGLSGDDPSSDAAKAQAVDDAGKDSEPTPGDEPGSI